MARRPIRAADRVADRRRDGLGMAGTLFNLMKTLGEPRSLGFPAPSP
jgi:hypothetical protein